MTEKTPLNESPEKLEETPAGMPLRGMAMILIAVAVLLAAWGAYSATRGEDSNASGGQLTPVTQVPASQAPDTRKAGEDSSTTSQPKSQEKSEADTPEGAVAKVHVLNNSTVPGLAADISEQLEAHGWELGEVGNFADQVLPENTVFFTPGNPAAEEAAKKLAAQVGAVAAPRPEGLPAGTEDPSTLVLILTGETAVR